MEKSKKTFWKTLPIVVFSLALPVFGINYNCNNQFDEYYPLFEQNSVDIKKEFEKGDYAKTREFIKNQKDMFWQLDSRCGEMYLMLFQRGREIRSMYEKALELESSMDLLE